LTIIIIIIIIIIIFKPSTNEGREKNEKVKKNGEANVPSGRPTQIYCATKQGPAQSLVGHRLITLCNLIQNL